MVHSRAWRQFLARWRAERDRLGRLGALADPGLLLGEVLTELETLLAAEGGGHVPHSPALPGSRAARPATWDAWCDGTITNAGHPVGNATISGSTGVQHLAAHTVSQRVRAVNTVPVFRDLKVGRSKRGAGLSQLGDSAGPQVRAVH